MNKSCFIYNKHKLRIKSRIIIKNEIFFLILKTRLKRKINFSILKKSDKKVQKKFGPDRGSNSEPLAPEARIIPLDHQASGYDKI